MVHLGAQWTSRRIWLATLALTLAAVGDRIAPMAFAALLAASVLGQLLLEALTVRAGAATVWEPLTTQGQRLPDVTDSD